MTLVQKFFFRFQVGMITRSIDFQEKDCESGNNQRSRTMSDQYSSQGFSYNLKNKKTLIGKTNFINSIQECSYLTINS